MLNSKIRRDEYSILECQVIFLLQHHFDYFLEPNILNFLLKGRNKNNKEIFRIQQITNYFVEHDVVH